MWCLRFEGTCKSMTEINIMNKRHAESAAIKTSSWTTNYDTLYDQISIFFTITYINFHMLMAMRLTS